MNSRLFCIMINLLMVPGYALSAAQSSVGNNLPILRRSAAIIGHRRGPSNVHDSNKPRIGLQRVDIPFVDEK